MKQKGLSTLRHMLARRGYEIVPAQNLYAWQRHSWHPAALDQTLSLPPGAASYLRPDNPMLLSLQSRYSVFDRRVTTPLVWTDKRVSDIELRTFRGDNAYVYQLRGKEYCPLAYALATYYAESVDGGFFLNTVVEDSLFGVHTTCVNGRLVSRDLLDSVLEICFLERNLKISSIGGAYLLDIGSGYGRLAHRAVTILPNIDRYFCTDGYAVSTFICEYYLSFRQVSDRAVTIPLDEIETVLARYPVEVALNVHSFPECQESAIAWWLSLLSEHEVRYLFVVTDKKRLVTYGGADIGSIAKKYKYSLVVEEPKYRDPIVQEYGLAPDYYFLFERR